MNSRQFGEFDEIERFLQKVSRYMADEFNEAFQEFEQEFQQEFERAFGGNLLGTQKLVRQGFTPQMDVLEDDASITIFLELPGMTKEGVEVVMSEDHQQLTIRGSKQPNESAQHKRVTKSERVFGSFERVVQIPASIDETGITGTLENGVLRLVLPKLQPVKPKEIPIYIQ